MWTDERVELLQRLWGQGYSASQIANQLQGVTRNAVIGKIHRLGKRERSVAARARPAAYATSTRRLGASQARRTEQREGAVPWVSRPNRLFAITEEPGLATCVTLGSHMCKWPIGDPDESGFSFCGRPSDGERPYCQGHARLAYKGSVGTPTDMARLYARYL